MVGLLSTNWRVVRDAWSRNWQNITLAHLADDDCSGAPSGGVLCSPEPNGWADSNDLTACQMLWASRLRASQSLESAKEAFGQALDCTRQPLVIAWGGELAWLENDRQGARQWWQEMGTEELIDWGYALLLDGGIEQGEYLLDLVVERDRERNGQRPGVGPPEGAAADALFILGHAFRMRGDWSRATDRYKAAHRMVPENIEITFYLGMSYRQSGQPDKAVGILEEGLDDLPANQPEFVSDYFAQLGLAYRESGFAAKAVTAFQQSLVWLGKVRAARPEQESFIQDLLDQSLRSIDANP